ncbi:MAG: hypothetical protein HY322_00400 [Betaproteobacteria bacterium]|nr:hypothetical protein [Betaproteobacteria bacterium]
MFGWFKKSKPAHPLADLDKTRELVATLPPNDSPKALERIGGWLDSITQAREFEVQQRWEAVDVLDQAAVAHRRKLAQDYISGGRAKKADEEKLWNASLAFWKALGAAYLRCISQVRATPDAEPLAKEVLARIAARALRTAGLQLKWIYLRHGQAEERIWHELRGAYLFAENQGVAALRAELYAEDRGASSAQEELLKALMLVMASPHNLEALQLHLAERFVAHFAGRFVLAEARAPDCAYAFDLALAKPPLRVHKDMAPGSMLRFFGAGEAERGLAELMQEIRAKDGIPGDVNLGGHFDTETVLSVLAHLARMWDTTPPARRAKRSGAATRVTVVPGLPNILRCLELAAGGAALEPKSFAEQESWAVVDKSDSGYGVMVPEERGSFEFDPVTGVRVASGDWLRIGSLVALREEGAPTWRIGVVRRITYDASNRRRAGIGLIEGVAAVVRLAQASGPRAAEPERRRSAVLMSHASEAGTETLVLMRAGHFLTTQKLAMQLDGRDYILEPDVLIEAGADFDCARFRMAPA